MSDASATRASALLRVVANGEDVTLDAPATVADLVVKLGLTGRRVALEHNGRILPRSRHDSTRLADGDRIEIVHAVGGG